VVHPVAVRREPLHERPVDGRRWVTCQSDVLARLGQLELAGELDPGLLLEAGPLHRVVLGSLSRPYTSSRLRVGANCQPRAVIEPAGRDRPRLTRPPSLVSVVPVYGDDREGRDPPAGLRTQDGAVFRSVSLTASESWWNGTTQATGSSARVGSAVRWPWAIVMVRSNPCWR
jgi:hypothetical protein